MKITSNGVVVVALRSAPPPKDEWGDDWKTQPHYNQEVSRARKALGNLLDAIDALPTRIRERERTDRAKQLPPDILLELLCGVGMAIHTMEEIVATFHRRSVSYETVRQIRNEAMRILFSEHFIAAPRIEELRKEFYDLVEAAELPEVALNNLAPEWRTECPGRKQAALEQLEAARRAA